MEIKRVADHFIIDLAKKQFHVYWPREWNFGENLIRRVCERMTEQEVYALAEVVNIMNSAIAKDRELTPEETDKFNVINSHMAHIFSLQVMVFCQTCPVECIEKIIEASHAYIWIGARKGHKEVFEKRFEYLETETEKKLMDTDNIFDWFSTRGLIARHITNDIMGCYRFALLNNDKKIIKSVMSKPTKDQITLYSLILQTFKTIPYHNNLDQRTFDTQDLNNLRYKIVELYKNVIGSEDCKDLVGAIEDTEDISKVLVDDNELDEFWRQIVATIKTARDVKIIEQLGTIKGLVESAQSLCPRKSLVYPGKYCTLSNTERRKMILEVFEYWDKHMPDDIAWIKEQNNIDKQIRDEKKAMIDAADKAYVGKTQDEMNAEKEKIELTVHDEDGKEIASTPLN